MSVKTKPLPPTPQATFAVVAVDQDTQQPIENAHVILSVGQEGQTNHDGFIAFLVNQGGLSYSVHHPDYEDFFSPALDVRGNLQVTAGLDGKGLTHKPGLVTSIPLSRRAGLVRGSGRLFVDDGGAFLPLGASFFWLPWGWRFDRDRTRQNLAWLAGRADYLRVFCEVGGKTWEDRTIDPKWPDYQDILAGCIDAAYDEFGMRTQLTLIAGGTATPPLTVASQVIEVVKGREQKILHFEAANESWQNLPDINQVNAVVKALRQAFPSHLVAGSAPKTTDPDGWKIVLGGGANFATGHFDRDDKKVDSGWRQVRQTWEARDLSVPGSQNEPAGPQSSVGTQERPVVLALQRAVGILCGWPAYVFHTGAGIRGGGAADLARGRSANFSELPDGAAQLAALRAIDRLLPADVPTWQKTSQHGGTQPIGPQPLLADAIWTDGSDHGVVRNYGAVSGGQFIQLPHGIKGHVSLTARQASTFTVFDPVTGTGLATHQLSAGQALTLDGPERPGGLDAYVIVGRV